MRTTVKNFGPLPEWKETNTHLILAHFKEMCAKTAEVEDCLCDINVYYDYRWFQAAFMTDRFGGIAAILKYVEDERAYFLDGVRYTTLDEALCRVPKKVRELMRKRDLKAVHEMIDAEY